MEFRHFYTPTKVFTSYSVSAENITPAVKYRSSNMHKLREFCADSGRISLFLPSNGQAMASLLHAATWISLFLPGNGQGQVGAEGGHIGRNPGVVLNHTVNDDIYGLF